MDLRDLRYFVAAAYLGHFHRAAATLNITQPALTKSVRRLEAQAGARLFEPVGRRVRLTELGEVLRKHARALLQAADDAQQRVRDFAAGSAGLVRIGASAAAVELLLPTVVERLVEAMPDVMLDISVGMNDVLCEDLKAGRLDLALCPIVATDPFLASRVLAKDPVVVVASARHPLFARRRIVLEDLVRYRWVLPSASAASTAWLAQVFMHRGLPVPVAQIRSASISLTPRLVAGTEFLSFIARRNLASPNVGAVLREIRLRAATLQRDFAVLWRRDGYLSPAASRIQQIMLREGGRLLGEPSKAASRAV